VVFPLVPKLWLGNGLTEAGASAHLCSQAGAWEQEAKDLHPLHLGHECRSYAAQRRTNEQAGHTAIGVLKDKTPQKSGV
jgi:hypothetical protein